MKSRSSLVPFLFLILFIGACKGPGSPNDHKTTYLFIGSYTSGKPAEGIYLYRIDTAGALTKVSNTQSIINPSFIILSPDGAHLYACTETRMHNAGSISAFSFDSVSGRLSFINKQPTDGENPVYITENKTSQWLISANYTGGSVSVFPVNLDGSLQPHNRVIQYSGSSINEERQDSSHIHSVIFSPNEDYLFAPDLGTDKIRLLSFYSMTTNKLEAIISTDFETTPGSGPRHITFHPSGRFAYCNEELSGTVSAYTYKNGKLTAIQRIASYAGKQEEYGCADIHVSPDGRFLYSSNREDEHSITIFSVDTTNGLLSLVGRQSTLGIHPRNFMIDPTGRFLLVANQFSNNIVVFRRDIETGLLTYTGNQINIPNPSCLQIRTYGK
jgi:6-phosphogluconolactonase (cycloisomerase 2 family)